MTLTAWLVAVVYFAPIPLRRVDAYATHDLHRRDMAGVWRLTSQKSFLPRVQDLSAKPKKFPMKEFTKWPKKKKISPPPTAIEEEEMLLMLSEDGSFMQYGKVSSDGVPDEDTVDKVEKPKFGIAQKKVDDEADNSAGVMKGSWDFVDGKLILAADRPQDADIRNVCDTILVGDVVVKAEESLQDNPALNSVEESAISSELPSSTEGDGDRTKNATVASTSNEVDVHISVPEGSVEIGKFMYPKNHPSFFEQPIFKPTPTGSFQLRQVLGSLNTRINKEDEEPEEKFRIEDLQGKRYFLTTYPLQQRKRKTITDVKPHERAEEAKKQAEEDSMPVPIRAVEIELFPNMTFTTLAGMGDSKILRGKWNIIGAEKDQLWMQVFRFGFGRSVSGSTYSEGIGLTQDDQKAYWGRIIQVGEDVGEDGNTKSSDADADEPKAIEINGSVLDGWGLEPLPVARFTMIEETEEFLDGDDDLDEDDEDELFRQSLENYDFGRNEDNEGETDPFSSLNAFQ